MACLIGQHPTVIFPGATPIILIIIALISAPAHAHGTQNQTSEPAGLESFPGLDHGCVEPVLLNDKKLNAGLVTGADHFISILKPQRHRLLDDYVFPCPCAGNSVL